MLKSLVILAGALVTLSFFAVADAHSYGCYLHTCAGPQGMENFYLFAGLIFGSLSLATALIMRIRNSGPQLERHR